MSADNVTMTLRIQKMWWGFRMINEQGQEMCRWYWWSPEVIQAMLRNLFGGK